MSKQFGQLGSAMKGGGSAGKMGAPGETPPIIGAVGHGAPAGDAGHGGPPVDASGDGSTPPILGDHQTDDPKKRKKIDWKGMIQDGLASADDNKDDMDPMNILQMHMANQNQYMNRPTY